MKLGMPVSRMLRELSSSELTELMAYNLIHPFDGDSDDYRDGLTAAMRINGQLREGAEPIDPRALMPWHRKPEDDAPPPSPDQVAQNIANLFATLPKATTNG